MERIQNEMKMLVAEEKLSQDLLTAAFEGIGYGID